MTVLFVAKGIRKLVARLARIPSVYAGAMRAVGGDLGSVPQTSATIYHDAPRGELSFNRSAVLRRYY
jgi:hypothetical protein